MDKYLHLIFLFIATHLFANISVTENDPNSLVEGVVSVVTGDLYVIEEDIVVQGAEPLRLKRNYISAKGFGDWWYFQHLQLISQPIANLMNVWEPNGTVLTYRYQMKEIKKKRKKKDKI